MSGRREFVYPRGPRREPTPYAPAGPSDAAAVQRQFRPRLLEALTGVCQEAPTYLDKFYALQPGGVNGAKRLILLLPMALRSQFGAEWLEDVGACATLVWGGATANVPEEMEAHEYARAE